MVRMPTVTDFGRRPTPRPANQVQAAPIQAATAVAREVEQFGRETQEAGDRMLERMSINQARERDTWFNNQVRDLLYDPQNGYFATQGANSFQSRQTVEQRIEALREEALNGLNNTATEALAPALRNRVDSYLTRMDQHAMTQLRVYETNLETARIASARQTALEDPSRLDEALNEIEETVLNRAAREGWSQEQTDVALREEESAVYRAEIARIAEDDPVAALDLLRNSESEMLATDFIELETALEPLAAERRGYDRADSLFNGSGQVFNHQTNMEFGGGASGALRPNDTIIDVVGSAVHQVLGPGARVVVTSGLRPNDAGSQHSTGGAMDFAIYRADGSQIMWDDPDLALIGQAASAMGAMGFGWGPTYMGGTHFHFDMGTGGAIAGARGRVMVWSDDDGGPADAGPGAAQYYDMLSSASRNPSSVPTGQSSDAGTQSAMTLLRRFEGFRENSYWDVNADRVGYGSDTVTREDGTVERVTETTRVTRADAERDLERRLREEFIPSARAAIGDRAFAQLTPDQQGVLASLAYNYGEHAWDGSLSGVAEAIRDGDLTRAAQEIRALQTHNGGINRGRRLAEADIFSRGGTGTGREVTPGLPDIGEVAAIAEAIEDDAEREAFLQRYNQIAELRGAELLDNRRQASQAAYEFIEGGGRFDDLPLEMRRELGLEASRSLRAYSNSVNSSEPVQTDLVLYSQLLQMQMQDPQAFARQDLFMYSDRLSQSDLRGFIEAQASPMDDVTRTAASTLMTTANRHLSAAGFDTTPQAGSDDAVAVAGFQTNIVRWQEGFIQQNNRAPTQLEIEERIGQDLTEIVLRHRFNRRGRLFEFDMNGSTLTTDDDLTAIDLERELNANSLDINGVRVTREVYDFVRLRLIAALNGNRPVNLTDPSVVHPTVEDVVRALALYYQ